MKKADRPSTDEAAPAQRSSAREEAELRSALQALAERVASLEGKVTELARRLEVPERGAGPPVEAGSSRADLKSPEEAPAAPPAPEPPASIFLPDLPEPSPVAGPAPSDPPEVAEAASNPQNLFGPAGDDGRPCCVRLGLLLRDAMGAVYRAYDRFQGGYFAIRILAGLERDDQAEALEDAVARVIGLPHPNILRVRGCGRRENRSYIATDLVEGTPVGQAKLVDIGRICRLFRDVAEAVQYAHEEGVTHGDLNPENILLVQEGEQDRALVKDFGLAHFLETVGLNEAGKQAGLTIRNPAFLPPEQTKEARRTPTAAGDIYGLGASLYAALAGRPPFEGKTVREVLSRVMIEEPQPLERVRPDVRAALAVVVRRAMAKEIANRYESARELVEALTKFLEGEGTQVLSRREGPEPPSDPS